MRICILCEESKVVQVREKMKNDNLLKIECSPTGQSPATHYFCVMTVTQQKADALFAKRELTEMEISEPKAFLESRNLKIIN